VPRKNSADNSSSRRGAASKTVLSGTSRSARKKPASRKSSGRKTGKKGSRRSRWLWISLWFGAVILVAALIAFQVVNRQLNLVGNIIAQRSFSHPNPLRILGDNGRWIEIQDLTGATIDSSPELLHQSRGLKVERWVVSREPVDPLGKFLNAVASQEVLRIQISPLDFEFQTSFQPDFEGSTAERQLVEGGHHFSLTANFHDPEGRPLGWVVQKGTQVNPMFPAWSGFFFIKDGRPMFGPRSLLDETPGTVSEAFQVYPSLMKDHTVFRYVDLQPDRFFDGARITYRSLGGVRKDGTLVFILSGMGGVMNVAEVAQLARLSNIQHATLLDGGRALQYAIQDGRFRHRFHAFNTEWDWLPERLEPVRPPVFLTATRVPEIPPPP